MSEDRNCPFCKIVQGDDPDANEVYRDEHVVAFIPPTPAALGHTMLIPRKHVTNIWELDEDTATRLASAAIGLADALRAAVHPEGLNVIQSNGEAATQTVLHLHVHLVPRWSGDAMGPIWPTETNFSQRQKDATVARVRRACRLAKS